jgi:anti-sigma factor RsiW
MATEHCTSVQELSAHLDGELSPQARVTLEAHLKSCPGCAAKLAELSAVGAVLRRRFEAQAEARDFSGFSAAVLARLQPYRPSLGERLSVGWEEWKRHRAGNLFGGLALAAAALLAVFALPQLRSPVLPPVGEGHQHPTLQAVSTDEQSHIAPVVLKTEGGDAIIWLVDHPDRPSLSIGTDASVPDVAPPSPERPKGGQL